MADVAGSVTRTNSQVLTGVVASNLSAMSTGNVYIVPNSGQTRLIVVKTGTSGADFTVSTFIGGDRFDNLTFPTREVTLTTAGTYVFGPFRTDIYSTSLRLAASANSTFSFMAIEN